MSTRPSMSRITQPSSVWGVVPTSIPCRSSPMHGARQRGRRWPGTEGDDRRRPHWPWHLTTHTYTNTHAHREAYASKHTARRPTPRGWEDNNNTKTKTTKRQPTVTKSLEHKLGPKVAPANADRHDIRQRFAGSTLNQVKKVKQACVVQKGAQAGRASVPSNLQTAHAQKNP